MKILITGGTGFIGYHLAKKLSENGHFVKCLVRKKSNIDLLKNLNVELMEGDLQFFDSLDRVLKDIDIVYHLAGVVYSKNKESFVIGNVLCTKNLLEALKNNNIRKFVYVSSVAVYKPSKKRILLNEYSVCEPISSYGKSKLKAEELIINYYHKYKFPVVIVRAPIIYGAHQPSVLTNFFSQIIKHKKIVIFGDGNFLRSFCYIDNFIDALILIGKYENSNIEKYNISDKEVYSYNKIIGTISRIIQSPVTVIRLPKIFGDLIWQFSKLMERFFGLYFIEAYAIKTMTINLGCDISKIEEDLGYYPTVELEQGLKETIKWINKEV